MFLQSFFYTLFLLISTCNPFVNENFTEVLVIGGGASGTAAAVKSARLGVNTILIEETPWLGGMLTSAGVSAIDGNHKLPGGFWGEFRDSLINRYGSAEALETGWVSKVLFEPSVGNDIFQNIVAKEKNLTTYFQSGLVKVVRKKNFWIASVKTPNGVKKIKTKILIDATELGDVAKMCKVGYDIGMEARSATGEPAAPEKANNIVQDLTFVATLKDYGKDVTISRPKKYNPKKFACACVNPNCVNPKEPERVWSAEEMITYGKLPNNKFMINWPIEGNDFYVNLIEMSDGERAEALKRAKEFTLEFVYFIQKELGMNTLGLADDEYPTSDNFPLIPYHRESRRIHGLVRFNENHLTNPYEQKEKLYRTAIAVGDYPVDHHHKRYEGEEQIPDLYFHPVPSYGLPLGTLIPKHVDGLIVAEKSISVSNIVNGTTRLQPVVLQIGDAAGTLAAIAVKQNKKIVDVSVRDVQKSLLENGGYLLPYLDLEKSDPHFPVLQRIGATGILKGVGKNVGWSNETWFRKDDALKMNELEGLNDLYPEANINKNDSSEVSWEQLTDILTKILKNEQLKQQVGKSNTISRLEAAVLIDKWLNPFEKGINIKGEFVK